MDLTVTLSLGGKGGASEHPEAEAALPSGNCAAIKEQI